MAKKNDLLILLLMTGGLGSLGSMFGGGAKAAPKVTVEETTDIVPHAEPVVVTRPYVAPPARVYAPPPKTVITQPPLIQPVNTYVGGSTRKYNSTDSWVGIPDVNSGEEPVIPEFIPHVPITKFYQNTKPYEFFEG